MSYGAVEQIGPPFAHGHIPMDKPWRKVSRNGYKTAMKNSLHRRERQRSRLNVECFPQYRKFRGWEW
jgi:hypothetical protein